MKNILVSRFEGGSGHYFCYVSCISSILNIIVEKIQAKNSNLAIFWHILENQGWHTNIGIFSLFDEIIKEKWENKWSNDVFYFKVEKNVHFNCS
jgi:hypothetical protein